MVRDESKDVAPVGQRARAFGARREGGGGTSQRQQVGAGAGAHHASAERLSRAVVKVAAQRATAFDLEDHDDDDDASLDGPVRSGEERRDAVGSSGDPTRRDARTRRSLAPENPSAHRRRRGVSVGVGEHPLDLETTTRPMWERDRRVVAALVSPEGEVTDAARNVNADNKCLHAVSGTSSRRRCGASGSSRRRTTTTTAAASATKSPG